MPPSTGQQKIALPGVKTILAIASGKGGVGKSTVATNLALAIQMHGNRVGLVDATLESHHDKNCLKKHCQT